MLNFKVRRITELWESWQGPSRCEIFCLLTKQLEVRGTAGYMWLIPITPGRHIVPMNLNIPEPLLFPRTGPYLKFKRRDEVVE